MWRDSFKIYNDHLDCRQHSINTAKWAMQVPPHRLFLRTPPKYWSNYLEALWAIYWCILVCKWYPMLHAMHPHQFQMLHTMLRWLYFDSMNVVPWRMFSVSINPNWRHDYHWICLFSSQVVHLRRSIGTMNAQKYTEN